MYFYIYVSFSLDPVNWIHLSRCRYQDESTAGQIWQDIAIQWQKANQLSRLSLICLNTSGAPHGRWRSMYQRETTANAAVTLLASKWHVHYSRRVLTRVCEIALMATPGVHTFSVVACMRSTSLYRLACQWGMVALSRKSAYGVPICLKRVNSNTFSWLLRTRLLEATAH